MRGSIRMFVAVVLLLGTAAISIKAGPAAQTQPQTSEWHVVSSPTTNDLSGISFVSPDEGWAVGEAGTLLYYTDGHWSVEASPVPDTMNLGAVAMVSAAEGWIEATGNDITEDWGSKLLYYDGVDWTAFTELDYQSYRDLSALPGDKVWVAAGGHVYERYGEILYFDGSELQVQWSQSYPDLPRAVDMLSTTQGWAVGGGGTPTLKYNGSTWQEVSSPDGIYLAALDMLSAYDGWAVGQSGAIVRYTGLSWQKAPSPTSNFLRGISMVSASEGWAVGDQGTLLHYRDGAWSVAQSPTTTDLNAIAMVSSDEGWAVGDDGTILRYGSVHRTFLPTVLHNSPPQPPAAPTLHAIENPDGDGNYGVAWSAVAGADAYTLEEDGEPSFSSPATVYSGAATLAAISGRDVGTYYYRVRGSNAAGIGDWSNVESVAVTIPPPPCGLTCGADAGGWWFEITCESGPFDQTTQSLQYWDPERGWVTVYDIDRTYTESGRSYQILAEYWRVYSGSEIVGRVTVAVTGGVFGQNTQHCQNFQQLGRGSEERAKPQGANFVQNLGLVCVRSQGDSERR